MLELNAKGLPKKRNLCSLLDSKLALGVREDLLARRFHFSFERIESKKGSEARLLLIPSTTIGRNDAKGKCHWLDIGNFCDWSPRSFCHCQPHSATSPFSPYLIYIRMRKST